MNPTLGHDTHYAVLRAAIESERLHHAWLLHGPRGVGKASFANALAAWLLAKSAWPQLGDDFSLPADHPTAALIAAGSHPDLVMLERLENEKTGALARNITVDQVRALRAVFATTPSQGMRRVVVVDSIDDMERGAANALLKGLEEPPAGTVFLMVSHTPGHLLPTIRSRCRALAFGRLDDAVMSRVLASKRADAAAGHPAAIASAAGSAGAALAAIDSDVGDLDQTLAMLAASGDPTNAVRARLAAALSGKAATARYQAFLARVPGFIAMQARGRSGPVLAAAIVAWEAAQQLAGIAIGQSLSPESVVIELAGQVATLARPGASATG